MKILFATSEAHPLVKTGGLGDISGSLPTALKRLRQDVRLILPAYPQAKQRAGKLKELAELALPGTDTPVKLLEGKLPNTRVPVYLIDSPMHFDRAGDPYRASDGRDWQDNHVRFAIFARAIAKLALDQAELDWQPDVLHCNDWQTGLAPALLSVHPDRPKIVFTIHNLAYQGLFPSYLAQDLALSPSFWSPQALEFHGNISFIKGGLVYADELTTVSPTYAKEIRTQQFGYGLEGLLNHRAESLTGILNGVDYRSWNPQEDTYLEHHYDTEDLSGKQANKEALQGELGLVPAPKTPIVGHIGRMVEQKGVDLILDALPRLLQDHEVQVAILGSGDQPFETAASQLAARFPGRVSTHIGYNERLAHRIEAGSDLFLMPSRFEPCGLNQMYSLHYGTLPVVRRTGGLADTVVDTTPETLAKGTANGFVFEYAYSDALREAVERALAFYPQRKTWKQLMTTGMAQDFSWEHSAREYMQLYKSMA